MVTDAKNAKEIAELKAAVSNHKKKESVNMAEEPVTDAPKKTRKKTK